MTLMKYLATLSAKSTRIYGTDINVCKRKQSTHLIENNEGKCNRNNTQTKTKETFRLLTIKSFGEKLHKSS